MAPHRPDEDDRYLHLLERFVWSRLVLMEHRILAAIRGNTGPVAGTFAWNGQDYPITYHPETRTFIVGDATFPDTGPATAKLNLTDANEVSTLPEAGSLAWSVDRTDFATLEVSADGTEATVSPVQGQAGTPTVVSCLVTDAAADGVAPFTLQGSVTFDPSAPATGSVEFTLDPTPTPTPTPAQVHVHHLRK